MDILNKLFGKDINKFSLSTFDNTFTKCRNGMIVNGIYPGTRKIMCSIWVVFHSLVLSSGISILSYTAFIDIQTKDYSDATRQMSILFLLSNMLIKMATLLYHRGTVRSMIDRLNADYEHAIKYYRGQRMIIVKNHALGGIWISNVWASLTFIAGATFPISAILITMYSAITDSVTQKRMVFYCILPWFDEYKYDFPLFEIIGIYEGFMALWSLFLFTSFDVLVPIFSLHMCAQLELVKLDLQGLFVEGEKNSEELIQKRLVKIVQHLQKIYRFGDDMNSTFSTVYQIIFSSTPLLSTAACFQIYSCILKGEIPFEFMFFFIATIFHTFIPSYYGNLIFEKSLTVTDAAYNSHWEIIHNKSARDTLLIVMLRGQRPLQLATKFKPVSLPLFSEVSQQSWTLFNLLMASLS